MLAAAGLIRPDAAAATDPLAEGSDGRIKGKADTGTDALNAVGEDGRKRLAVADLKDDLPAASAADLAAKGRELLNVSAKAEGGHDFAAQIKDSIAVAGANASTAMQPTQAAPLINVATQGGLAVQAAEKLTPAVGSTAWDQALGQKVVWMVAGEQQTASLTLNPPDLGPLQIVLSVSNSQANATFTAAQPEVRQALEAAMPKLRDMLGEAGIQLGQATVNSGSANQQGTQDQHASHGRRGFGNENGGAGHIDEPTRIGRVAPSSSGQGMVDTFA
jgi:flagellar hook-length control protein FliK